MTVIRRTTPSAFFGNKRRARGRTVNRVGVMNKTEAAYAATLTVQKACGQIIDWWFQPIRLRLSESDALTTWTPDFMVLYSEGTLELVDVKGWAFEDDARVKIKLAADKFYPFLVTSVTPIPKKDGGGWKRETFGWGE